MWFTHNALRFGHVSFSFSFLALGGHLITQEEAFPTEQQCFGGVFCVIYF